MNNYQIGMVLTLLLTMYLYGAMDTIRNGMITFVEKGLIKPHYTITRFTTKVFVFLTFTLPIINLYRLMYYSHYGKWWTYLIMTLMVVFTVAGFLWVISITNRFMFGEKSTTLNWLAVCVVIWVIMVVNNSPY